MRGDEPRHLGRRGAQHRAARAAPDDAAQRRARPWRLPPGRTTGRILLRLSWTARWPAAPVLPSAGGPRGVPRERYRDRLEAGSAVRCVETGIRTGDLDLRPTGSAQ